MPRVGLDADAVVRAAAQLADAEGLAGLTLARLARSLDVRTPSLYAHVEGLGDLRARLAIHGAEQLHAALAGATTGRAGRDALDALADAYRAFAHAHPGVYAALQRMPASGQGAGDAVVTTVVAALRGYGLEDEDAIHAVRLVRSALHGFVALELEGGFGWPLSVQESWRRLLEMLDRGLVSRP